MGGLKGTTDKVVGTAKEAVAEVVGDGKLQAEGKAQRRKGAAEKEEAGDLKPLGNLDKLT
jgi:uncharacterized protein YjbJ (UPF0337 family)